MSNETGDEYARTAEARPISHYMKAPIAAALLRERYGDAKAQSIALRKQREARRARSRRRFKFWTEVTSTIENCSRS